MRTLILALLWLVVQLAPSVAQKPSQGHDAMQRSVPQDSGAKATPNNASPMPNAVPTTDEEPRSRPSPVANADQSIVVRTLPPVTVNTDWWSKFYVIFTGVLMLVGPWVSSARTELSRRSKSKPPRRNCRQKLQNAALSCRRRSITNGSIWKTGAPVAVVTQQE